MFLGFSNPMQLGVFDATIMAAVGDSVILVLDFFFGFLSCGFICCIDRPSKVEVSRYGTSLVTLTPLTLCKTLFPALCSCSVNSVRLIKT